jgi:histidine ammonia-lyase
LPRSPQQWFNFYPFWKTDDDATLEPVTFGERPLRIEDVLALANRQAPTQLQDDAAYRERIAKGAQFLDSLLDKEGVIYGVTTGYGDLRGGGAAASRRSAAASSVHLPRLRPGQTARRPGHPRRAGGALQSLCHGVSGVRVELLERLHAFLEHDILPLIPKKARWAPAVT